MNSISLSEGTGVITSVDVPPEVLGDTVFPILVTFTNTGQPDHIRVRIIDSAINGVIINKAFYLEYGQEETVTINYTMPYDRDVFLIIEVSHMVGEYD